MNSKNKEKCSLVFNLKIKKLKKIKMCQWAILKLLI